jgi:hypothetical protein
MVDLDLFGMPDPYDGSDDDYWNEGEFLSPIVAPVVPQKKSEGCTCVKCKTFNPYAEPNQKDGSFKCYSCRNYG